jgi:hypothetical protein
MDVHARALRPLWSAVTWHRCVRLDPPSHDSYGAEGPAWRGNEFFLIHQEETRESHDPVRRFREVDQCLSVFIRGWNAAPSSALPFAPFVIRGSPPSVIAVVVLSGPHEGRQAACSQENGAWDSIMPNGSLFTRRRRRVSVDPGTGAC